MFLVGLVDFLKNRKDMTWLGSMSYSTVAVYAGLELETAWRIRRMAVAGELDLKRMQYAMCGQSAEAGEY